MTKESTEKRGNISIRGDLRAHIEEIAIERDISIGEAADVVLQAGVSRLKALAKYAKATTGKAPSGKRAPAAKKAVKKKAAKKAAKKKSKKAPTSAAAETSPALLDEPVGGNPFDDEDDSGPFDDEDEIDTSDLGRDEEE